MCNLGVAKIKNFVALKTKPREWEDENRLAEKHLIKDLFKYLYNY